jgi:RimJ/RimL family protein N-acetyltransferase
VRLDDAPLVFPYASEPALTRWMTWAPHRDPGATADFLRSCVEARRRGVDWVWAILEGGRFRGLVGVEGAVRQVAAVRHDRAELGYWIGIPFHGRGLVTEAARVATAFGFARLALHKIVVRAVTANAPSLRVIQKLGFTEVGLHRREVQRDGVWQDVRHFEMLDDDPAARDLQSSLHRAR